MVSAWLTPSDTPTETKCWRVFVPDGLEFEAVLRGALLALEREYNWQQWGTLTPAECAGYWRAANTQTFAMSACQETVSMVGAIVWWPNDGVPAWGLRCDGTVYLVADYPELYTVLSNRFGGTPGYSFAVPDLRNEMIVGAGSSFAFGSSGGEINHTLTEAELPTHEHYVKRITAGGTPELSLTWGSNDGSQVPTSSVGSSQPHNNMPPYLALTPIIVKE